MIAGGHVRTSFHQRVLCHDCLGRATYFPFLGFAGSFRAHHDTVVIAAPFGSANEFFQSGGIIEWHYTECELSQFLRFINNVICEFPGKGNEDAQPHVDSRGVRKAIFHGTMFKCFVLAGVPLGPEFARFRFSLGIGDLKKTPADLEKVIRWLYDGGDDVEPLRQELVKLFSKEEAWDPAYHAVIKQHQGLVSDLHRNLVNIQHEAARSLDVKLETLLSRPNAIPEESSHSDESVDAQTQTVENNNFNVNVVEKEQNSKDTASAIADNVLDTRLQITPQDLQASQNEQHIAASTQASHQTQVQMPLLGDPESNSRDSGAHHPTQYSDCPWRECPRPASSDFDFMEVEPYQNENVEYCQPPCTHVQLTSLPLNQDAPACVAADDASAQTTIDNNYQSRLHQDCSPYLSYLPSATTSMPAASDFAPSGVLVTSRQRRPLLKKRQARK